jgi:hypothetical protein
MGPQSRRSSRILPMANAPLGTCGAVLDGPSLQHDVHPHLLITRSRGPGSAAVSNHVHKGTPRGR